MIEIDGRLINKNNIVCVSYVITDCDGYMIIIRFIGGYTIELHADDKEELDKWWEMLK